MYHFFLSSNDYFMLRLWLIILQWPVRSHLFVDYPAPFQAHEDISQLIMPLNEDSYLRIGQQPFPCKDHHKDLEGSGGQPVVEWKSGQKVTIS